MADSDIIPIAPCVHETHRSRLGTEGTDKFHGMTLGNPLRSRWSLRGLGFGRADRGSS
jgi:hypothetical protein